MELIFPAVLIHYNKNALVDFLVFLAPFSSKFAIQINQINGTKTL